MPIALLNADAVLGPARQLAQRTRQPPTPSGIEICARGMRRKRAGAAGERGGAERPSALGRDKRRAARPKIHMPRLQPVRRRAHCEPVSS